MSAGVPFANTTWNPWQGCSPQSAGCENCYMYREKIALKQDPTIVHRSSDATFDKPKNLKPGTWVFTCSWSDFFIKEADHWRNDAWKIIYSRPDICFVIITKRHNEIKERLPANWHCGYDNVVLGFTAEDQGYFNLRWSVIRKIPAKSYLCIHEPALGAIKYANDFLSMGPKAWVISGGETGQNARPAHVSYFRKDREQCLEYNVPFFFKGWGEWCNMSKYVFGKEYEWFNWPDNSTSIKLGKKISGDMLDYVQHHYCPSVYLNSIQQSLF